MSANYRNPNFLLPNELNQSINPDLSVDRHSLYSTEFNGTSSYIDIGSTISGTGAATISMWLNTDTVSSQNRILSNTDNNSFTVFFDSGTIQVGGGSEGNVTVVSSVAVDYQWFHLCLVFDGSGNVTGYKNGVAGSAVATSSSRSNLGLGAKLGLSYGYYYNGTMDEVALFNTALTQSQVQALADSKNSPVNIMALDPKPIAYYPLGEEARNTGYLSSGSDVSGSEWQFPNQSIQSTAVNFENSGAPSSSQTGGRIDLGSTTNLGTQNTISFWFKAPPASPAANNSFCMIGNQYASGKYTIFIYQTLLYIRAGNNNGGALYWSIGNLLDSEWHNIIVNRNGASASLYIDGVGWPAPSVLSGGLSATDNTFIDTIGAVYPPNIGSPFQYYYNGEMSNVVAWNSDQTSEKDNIWNNGTPASSYTNTPTAWYKLNAANSSYNSATSTWTFTDSAGSNNGTSTTLPISALVRSDLQFESPYSNFSLDFDGITSTINVPDSSLLKPSKITVSMWIKGGTQSTYTYCLAKYYTGSGVAYGFTTGSSTTKIAFMMRKGDDSGWVTTGFSTVMDDNWHNVIGTFDGTNVKLYVDGALTSTVASGTTGITYGSGDLTIGAFLNTGTLDFNGKIDETAIFNTALTAAQVNQIYNNGLASDLTSLSPVSWWRLGEDAYFVNNNITIPNQIAGGPSGTGSGTQTSMLVADAPGSYGSGSGFNLDIFDRVGEAPGTLPINVGNSQSYNMIPDDRHPYVPGYTPATVDNAASMDFDGTNDYIITSTTPAQLGFPATTVSEGSFSISFWYYHNTIVNYDVVLQSTNANADNGFGVWQSTTNNGLNFWVGHYLQGDLYTTNNYFTSQKWYNITCAFEGGSTHTSKIFIDGVLNNSVSYTTSRNIHSGENVLIGGWPLYSRYFDGKLDELAIFNYALTPKQIKEDIYNASKPISGVNKTADLNNNSNLTAPVAWYRMGD